MSSAPVRSLAITVAENVTVSALLQVPRPARACLVLAHGAGAGMTHPFLADMADGLAARGIATLRFQFCYIERGSRRPDAPPLAHAAIRAAVAAAARRLPRLPLFAGGKSFGARMTSQAQALSPLPRVRGLVFLGFPLHPARRPSRERAAHLPDVHIPMLFLQGTRDDLADLKLLKPLCRRLAPRATLQLFPHADHSFHVPARSGQTDATVRIELLDTIAAWMASPQIAPGLPRRR